MRYFNVDQRLARWVIAPEECHPPGELPAVVDRRRFLSPPVSVAPVEGQRTGTGPPVFFPPWLYPPFGVRPIDEPQNLSGSVIAPAASAVFAWPTVAAGHVGVVARIGVTSSDFSTTTVFQTRANANPIPPWSARTGNVGPIFEPPPLAAPILLAPGQTFDVFVTNNGAVAITVAVRILGWWYA
jgi:hypothetical protein